MKYALLSSVAFALAALSIPAHAQMSSGSGDPLEVEAVRIYKMLPRQSTILQDPALSSWTSYGADDQGVVRAKGVPGEQARRFGVERVGENRWDSAIQVPNVVPVKAGDLVHASFWMRAKKLPRGKAATRIPVSLQTNGEPYTQIAYEELEVGRDWTLLAIAGATDTDYGVEGMTLNLQVAGDVQVLEMGPVYLNTLGPGDVPGEVASQPAPTSAAAEPTNKWNAAGPVNIALLPADIQTDLRALLADLPPGAELISDAVVTDGAYGGPSRIVDDAGVPGGRALEVVTESAQIESWHTGVNLPITDRIEKDDILLHVVWAKTVDAPNEAQTATLQPIRLQQSVAPYTSAVEGAAYLSREWEMYFLPAEASNGFEAGPAGITYHLGLAPQTVRIGPSYVLRFPAGTDVRRLPKDEINYAGRAADAPWRAEAMRRIEQHRMAELTVEVRDRSGKPVPATAVDIEQTRHAFNFGTFTGHKFTTPQTEVERRWHGIFEESFNTATLPIYWADWGWAGPGTHEDDYKRAIQYAGQQNLPWRAHTVMWPGETYMPTRFKEATSVAARRKLVEDHVREVVTHIRDADLPPFAVDFTNEPRANRYFQENGDPTLVADMFRLAHSIAPTLPLYVNDYGILNNGGQNTAAIAYYHEWLERMRADGVPIGGIGFQGHFSAGLTPPEKLIEILEGFEKYDLPLHITEFDIETLDDEAQADYTRDAIMAALAVPSVEAFIFWGFYEPQHWKPNAAMIRADWTEKPAYTAMRKLVYDDLWTQETRITNSAGQVSLRGMMGDYTITVNGVPQAVALDADGETVVVDMRR